MAFNGPDGGPKLEKNKNVVEPGKEANEMSETDASKIEMSAEEEMAMSLATENITDAIKLEGDYKMEMQKISPEDIKAFNENHPDLIGEDGYTGMVEGPSVNTEGQNVAYAITILPTGEGYAAVAGNSKDIYGENKVNASEAYYVVSGNLTI